MEKICTMLLVLGARGAVLWSGATPATCDGGTPGSTRVSICTVGPLHVDK